MISKILKPWYLKQPSRILWRIFASKPTKKNIQKIPMAWGGRLEFDISGSIGWGAKTTGVVDLALSELLCHLIEPGDSVLDIGANVGGIAYLLARLVGKSGSVDAFEPHPQVHEILERNQSLNLGKSLANVKLHKVAVGEVNGPVDLYEDPSAASDGEASIAKKSEQSICHEVQMVTLSEATKAKEKYKAMKLDIEGHEFAALQSGEYLIAQKKIRNILFEDHYGPASPVFQYLKKFDYYLYAFGWENSGVKVVPAGKSILAKNYEAPNYWACADKIETSFIPGWKCLNTIPL